MELLLFLKREFYPETIQTMSKFILAFAAIAFIGITTNAQDYSESELQAMYQEFLTDEGFDNYIDSDGDVQFTHNDKQYFIEVNETDQEFFNLSLYNIWPVESTDEAVQVALAMDYVNARKKAAKLFTKNDNVWIAVEMFLEQPDQFKGVFNRCLKEIEGAMDAFVDEM